MKNLGGESTAGLVMRDLPSAVRISPKSSYAAQENYQIYFISLKMTRRFSLKIGQKSE